MGCYFCSLRHVLRSLFTFFFFNDTATTEIYTLSLHDALPISTTIGFSLALGATFFLPNKFTSQTLVLVEEQAVSTELVKPVITEASNQRLASMKRSEEHTSELQSHSDLVCRLLLEKKQNQRQ